MPHRIGYLWNKMVSNENCVRAELEMTRHKRDNPMADHIRHYADRYGEALSQSLSGGDFQFHECREVIINDSYKGKKRRLQIPVLEDQAAEQAWLLIAIPYLMRRGYHYSCSSIPGAGSSRAVQAIQKCTNKKKPPVWGCVTDIKKFFENCPHWVVRRGLRRIFKDKQFIDFASQCMLAMNPSGVGLAIGHPISPWLANLALTEIDHSLRYYYPEAFMVRYMDDIALLARNKRRLEKAIRSLNNMLKVRCMNLKHTWQIQKLKDYGLQFLSYRFYPNHTILTKKLMFRIARKMRRCKDHLSLHNARSVISYMGILKHCNSFQFRSDYVYPYVNPQQCRRMISHADNRFRERRKDTSEFASAA